MALQKELESPTFRLGGGRSIQLSYWSIYWNIVAENKFVVNLHVSTVFEKHRAYTVFSVLKGGEQMKECNDPYADLEDLIFDDDDGGPSER